jgi:hypothetical protein
VVSWIGRGMKHNCYNLLVKQIKCNNLFLSDHSVSYRCTRK